MLELRPSCEHCQKALAPESTEAMICSFECTFCRDCVGLLENFCPNCGGGFMPRPIRPALNLNDDNFLGKYPAGTRIVHKPVDLAAHRTFVRAIAHLAPHER